MTQLPQLPPHRSMPAAARHSTRRLLEDAAAAPTGGLRRWLSRGVVIGGTAALVLTSGAAVAFVALAPATEQGIVRCFTLPELGTADDFYGTDTAQASATNDGPVPIADALAACSDLWRQGALTYGVKTPQGPPQNSSRTVYDVPQLTACVLDSGAAGVFPADSDICSQLGLPRLQTEALAP